VFSRESVGVNRGPVAGRQLFMFQDEGEGSRGAYAARAFPRTRSSNSNQRSAHAQSHRRADREKPVIRNGSFATPIAPRSDAGEENRVNKVMLTGRLGRNARVRETSGGRVVTDFFLGTEEFSKDLRGDWQQKTAWHRVQAWGEAAEKVGRQLPEGSRLYVEGRLVIRKWTDKNNKRQTFTEILAFEVRFLDDAPAAPVGTESVASGPKPFHGGLHE
jgi:single-strand DNA-binding protein